MHQPKKISEREYIKIDLNYSYSPIGSILFRCSGNNKFKLHLQCVRVSV